MRCENRYLKKGNWKARYLCIWNFARQCNQWRAEGGRTGRQPRASKAPGIQRVKLQKLLCCNQLIFCIVRLLTHTTQSRRQFCLVARPKSVEIVDPGYYYCHPKASCSFACLFVTSGKKWPLSAVHSKRYPVTTFWHSAVVEQSPTWTENVKTTVN